MKQSGMNIEHVRQRNRSLILKFINNRGAASRKDIADATGLTAASVTQITTSLLSEGILRETGPDDAASGNPGRRRVMLEIDAGRFLTFAVNAEPDTTTVALCDLMGRVIRAPGSDPLLQRFPTDRAAEPERFLEAVGDRCEALARQLPGALRGRIECLSFAVTGIVDRVNGISRHAYGIWDREVDIRHVLGERTGLPVLVENNVDAFAIAEVFLGAGRKHDDLLVIKWGPGVGSSVIIDGDVYRGRHGKTAELGHVIVDPAGRRCVCGRRGCLETVVSAAALREAGDGGEKRRAIGQFARSIVNAGTILAPNRIVLFGSLSGDDALRNELIRACASVDPSYGEGRIVHTSLSDKESYIGPAALYTMDKLRR